MLRSNVGTHAVAPTQLPGKNAISYALSSNDSCGCLPGADPEVVPRGVAVMAQLTSSPPLSHSSAPQVPGRSRTFGATLADRAAVLTAGVRPPATSRSSASPHT